MTRLVKVTSAQFRNRFWQHGDSFLFTTKQSLVPVTAAEIASAAQAMPLAFVRQNDQFMLAGILSLIPGRNLYVGPDGRWLGTYVPSSLKHHPFMLASSKGSKAPVLCVDEDSGLINDISGEPFFDEQGRLSKPLSRVLTFLSQVRTHQKATDRIVSLLDKSSLIIPWDLKIRAGQDERPVTGLYMIDEAKLNTLDDAAFLSLRQSRGLALAYAQLFSMHNLSVLQKLVQQREPPGKKVPLAAKNLENIFFNQDDDMVSFGNI